MENTKPKVLTIKEAAKLIDGLSEYRIRQICISGQLPAFKAGNKNLISEKALFEAVFGSGGDNPSAHNVRIFASENGGGAA